jgi:outer membrane protein TolC
MPTDVLERRPDLVAAERRVAAAFYFTEEAKAARLPKISLVASFTSITSDMFVLQNRDNPVLSGGASLLQPIFLGGYLQAQVEAKTAEQKAAIADYGKTTLKAYGEVESALSASLADADREQILARSERSNARALELANVRFKVGSGDLRGVQQQQLALYAAQVALIGVQSDRLVQRVNLHLALGGGFDQATPVAAATPASSSASTTP